MNAILELLHNNEPLTAQLKGAASRDDATSIIIDAAKERGQDLNTTQVAEFFEQRPKTNPEPLSEEELEAVAGGRPIVLSDICCFTCRTSQVSW